MNIQEAKQQIKHAMIAYFSKDEYGNYEIPPEQQRPVFLLGAPGIGKTAIMSQIAQELGVGLVSYSMTHHTRQSALGLPTIQTRRYDGVKYQVSEYTMSEILASVYDRIERTGVREGILFLDEINCVSETLMPSMLQFLQFKTFGRHKVPDGWLVVTAGNPLEYNRSAREFDVVTLDRMKKIEVEPDYEAWRGYAAEKRLHPAVLTYLDLKRGNFYRVETTPSGKCFVTARGWEDLARMLRLYEKHELPVDEKLIGQYLQDRAIAKDFAVYYDLFNHYRSDYQIEAILSGQLPEEIVLRAARAKFDERVALLGMLAEAVCLRAREQMEQEKILEAYLQKLQEWKQGAAAGSSLDAWTGFVRTQTAAAQSTLKHSDQSSDRLRAKQGLCALLLQEQQAAEAEQETADDVFPLLRQRAGEQIRQVRSKAEQLKQQLEAVFEFCEVAFSARSVQELLILVTELTMDPHTSAFISRYGCEGYFRHNRELMFSERQRSIEQKLDALTRG